MWFEGRTKTGKRKETVSKEPFENVVKTKVSEKTRSLANPMGPSGAPSALRGSQSSAKAHIEKRCKNKGNEGFLCEL